jgi:23S rRNA (cytosine1962-C5)-methyltransferase
VVSCTCSGAVDHETFSRALSNALRKSGQRGAWIAQGAQGLDHPRLPQFPEGHYLKMILTEIL